MRSHCARSPSRRFTRSGRHIDLGCVRGTTQRACAKSRRCVWASGPHRRPTRRIASPRCRTFARDPLYRASGPGDSRPMPRKPRRVRPNRYARHGLRRFRSPLRSAWVIDVLVIQVIWPACRQTCERGDRPATTSRTSRDECQSRSAECRQGDRQQRRRLDTITGARRTRRPRSYRISCTPATSATAMHFRSSFARLRRACSSHSWARRLG